MLAFRVKGFAVVTNAAVADAMDKPRERERERERERGQRLVWVFVVMGGKQEWLIFYKLQWTVVLMDCGPLIHDGVGVADLRAQASGNFQDYPGWFNEWPLVRTFFLWPE